MLSECMEEGGLCKEPRVLSSVAVSSVPALQNSQSFEPGLTYIYDVKNSFISSSLGLPSISTGQLRTCYLFISIQKIYFSRTKVTWIMRCKKVLGVQGQYHLWTRNYEMVPWPYQTEKTSRDRQLCKIPETAVCSIIPCWLLQHSKSQTSPSSRVANIT